MAGAFNRIMLTHRPEQVTAVRIGGRILSQEEYRLDVESGDIVLHSSFPGGTEVIVDYESLAEEPD